MSLFFSMALKVFPHDYLHKSRRVYFSKAIIMLRPGEVALILSGERLADGRGFLCVSVARKGPACFGGVTVGRAEAYILAGGRWFQLQMNRLVQPASDYAAGALDAAVKLWGGVNRVFSDEPGLRVFNPVRLARKAGNCHLPPTAIGNAVRPRQGASGVEGLPSAASEAKQASGARPVTHSDHRGL